MKIGPLELTNPVILAPLAGITNLPFRLMVKNSGCGLVYSEMVSANGLIHKSKKTFRLLDSRPEEKPLAVQIFGTDPSIMAEAARIVASSGADILDINFGCSVKKVVKTGAGVALMQNPEQTEKLLTAVRKAVHIPLTIKIRTGWDRSGKQAQNIAQVAANCGVDAICVHPRTAKQGFRGCADWSIIAAVKKCVAMPVIGNGDVMTPVDAQKLLRATGCDAVMIGRAAIGNPQIFSQIICQLNGLPIKPFDLDHHIAQMIDYFKSSIEYLGEKQGCRMMRSRLGWFVKGLHSNKIFRETIKTLSNKQQGLAAINDYADYLRRRSHKSVRVSS